MRNSYTPRALAAALAFVVASSAAAASGAAPKPAVDVDLDCNTFVGAFQVDPVAARAALPPAYELELQGDGNALVFLQASNCSAVAGDVDLSPVDLADVWLVIQGPPDHRPIPGAAVTLPTTYVYVLEAQTTSRWIKTHTTAIHFPKVLVRSLDVGGPIVPMRHGEVVETNGSSYGWDEFVPCLQPPGTAHGECWMFPPPAPPLPVGFLAPEPFPLGYNIRGYVQGGEGMGATKDMGCLMNVHGQGLVQLTLDPKSALAKLGIFQSGQVGLFFDSMATCRLVMRQQ
jgi:hypothetical protein